MGGAAGGTEGRQVMTLDEFEMQAAHYNIACAYARLDQISQVSYEAVPDICYGVNEDKEYYFLCLLTLVPLNSHKSL